MGRLRVKTYTIGYDSPYDDFYETEFDAEDITDLFNLFLEYAEENKFLRDGLHVNYITEREYEPENQLKGDVIK